MTAVLEWVKQHLLIVILIAVSIIVLPVVIVATTMWNASIQEEIASRVQAQSQKLNAVQNTRIEIKPLVPGAAGVETTVTVNEALLEQYRRLREAIRQDADDLIAAAIAVNQAGKDRPLVEGLLPQPARAVAQELPYSAYPAYVRAHDDLLRYLRAGQPPDPASVRDELFAYSESYRRSQFNVGPQATLRAEDQEKLDQAMTQRRLALYRDHAAEISVYADRDVFFLESWDNQTKPDEYRWYEWQHTYWLHSDLARAIVKANTHDGERQSAAGRPGSVVKRIISIKAEPIFPREGGTRTFGQQRSGRDTMTDYFPSQQTFSGHGGEHGVEGPRIGGTAFSEPPGETPTVDAFSNPDAPFPADFSGSLSGRPKSSALYDVRKVRMTMIVDSSRLDRLFDAINTTNFMVITGCNIESVDVVADLSRGYYYGPTPVVRVDLTIETVWLRDWTVPYMPPSVRTILGVEKPGDR